MPSALRRALLACSSTLVVAAFAGSDAHAQAANSNVLPEITVTQSPIVTRRSTAAPGDAGQNLSDLLDESFSAVTTMTTEQIERERGGALGNGGSIGNLLFDKPGITGSTFAPGASRPVDSRPR